jgi:hypothetical protein
MAVSQSVLEFLAKHPCAPAINFTFEVPALRKRNEQGKAKFVPGKRKMLERQIKVHEAALVAILQWPTALCTRKMMPLAGASLPIQTCIRFICTHTLYAPDYVQHLTDKFITDAGKLALSSLQVTELVKSCRGDDDALLVGLAAELVAKKLNGQIAATQLNIFLYTTGSELLKKKVETMEKDMGFKVEETASKAALKTTAREGSSLFTAVAKHPKGSIQEITDDEIIEIDTDTMEVDADVWQLVPHMREEAESSKCRKVAQPGYRGVGSS